MKLLYILLSITLLVSINTASAKGSSGGVKATHSVKAKAPKLIKIKAKVIHAKKSLVIKVKAPSKVKKVITH